MPAPDLASGSPAARQGFTLARSGSVLLASLSDEQRARLQRQGAARAYAAGERVAQGGQPWPRVVLVHEGEMEVVKESGEGRSLIPRILSRGELFLGALVTEDGLLPVSLRARTPLLITVWSTDDFLSVLEMDPRSLRPLCRELATYMARAAECIERLAFQPLRGRLAHLLLTTYRPTPGSRRKRFLTLDQMAERLGTTREVVCRLIRGFAAEGFLETTRDELHFRDVVGLRAVAGGTPAPGRSAGPVGPGTGRASPTGARLSQGARKGAARTAGDNGGKQGVRHCPGASG